MNTMNVKTAKMLTFVTLVMLVSSVPAGAMESMIGSVFPATSQLDYPYSDEMWPSPKLIRVNDEARVICIASCMALGATPFVGPVATAACIAACPIAIRR